MAHEKFTLRSDIFRLMRGTTTLRILEKELCVKYIGCDFHHGKRLMFLDRMRLLPVFGFLAFCLLLTSSASYAFSRTSFDLKEDIKRQSWERSEELKKLLKKHKGYRRTLVSMKASFLKEDFKSCGQLGKATSRKAVRVAPWVLALELQCLREGLHKKSVKLRSLVHSLRFADSKLQWLVAGPYSKELRKQWVLGHLASLNVYLRVNPKRAQSTLNKLLRHKEWLTTENEAAVYKAAGELAFSQQRFAAAEGYLKRSLALHSDPELEGKLRSIKKRLDKAKNSEVNEVVVSNEELEASEEEIRLVKQVSESLEGGDFINGIEYALELIEKFPGGLRAKWASERIFTIYQRVIDQKNKNFEVIRERVQRLVEKAEVPYLIEWGRKLYWDGHYQESYRLSSLAFRRLGEYRITAEELNSIARSTYAVGKWKEAQKYYEKLLKEYAGTEESREALYRLGLIGVRTEKFSEARGHFERLLVIPNTDEYELRARYWLWRSLQKLKTEGAEDMAKTVYERFPLSYYGLRAQAELNKGKVSALKIQSNDSPKLKLSVDLLDTEKEALQRLNDLLEIGWFEEAQEEIAQLPPAATSELKIFLARKWLEAGHDLNAIILVNDVWDASPEYIDEPLVKLAYPRALLPLVKEVAEQKGVDPIVVLSLIRQESAFNKEAVSRSGALGLMQLIPPTAREVAQELGEKRLELPKDMFQPKKNIQFGTHYIHKMMEEFDHHLPLSFAAYNAGPHRLKKWLESRDIKPEKTIQPLEELWVEELPWAETRFYVKAILRNILIYRYLDQGPLTITDPFWKVAQSDGPKQEGER